LPFYDVLKIFAFVIVKGKDTNKEKDNGKKQKIKKNEK
jgi:hypothetical protein